jgi:small conductance mechanosensitive channel
VTLDYRRLYVPNRKIWNEVIENRSAESLRRVQRKTRISYQEDLDKALEVIRELLTDHEMVLEDPGPFIYVSDLADSWVEIAVWPYVKAENWWAFYMELPRLIRNRFEERGIAFPLPGRDVHISSPTDSEVN